MVYIVDRRVIVDQASAEVENIRKKINEEPIKSILGNIGGDLNVSRLRGGGGLDDSRQWLRDPHKPAIIVGTTDMIGSRLLFSGYGAGKKIRSFYAGLLGQDSLIVLDETHLSPAMERVLKDIKHVSHEIEEKNLLYPPKILLMSATQHTSNSDRLGLDEDDLKLENVKKRYKAPKKLELQQSDKKEVQNEIFNHAIKMSGRVIIYVQKPSDAKAISKKLRKEEKESIVLTGTIRGFERDRLADEEAYNAFLDKEWNHDRTVYMVSTSAGEVGADFDADHMVCDMTTMDSFIQRLGRVNRSGGRKSSIVVVYSKEDFNKKDKYSESKKATAHILEKLVKENNNDVSPHRLDKIPSEEKNQAFSPTPETQPLTKEILDMWSMTSIYKEYSSRPKVSHWLHGKPERSEPDTYIVWRDDVEYLTDADDSELEHLFERHRILPQEIVREKTNDVYNFLKQLGSNDNAIIITNGRYEKFNISKDVQERKDLKFATIVLPCRVGGLNSDGFLDVKSKRSVLDVADIPHMKNRIRVLVKEVEEEDGSITEYVEKYIGDSNEKNEKLDEWYKSMPNMKLVHRQNEPSYMKEDGVVREVRYYRTVKDKPQKAQRMEKLQDHLEETEGVTRKILEGFSHVHSNIKDAVITAARYHDLGKDNEHWQKCMWIEEAERPLAKSGNKKRPMSLGGFRHELLSTHMALKNDDKVRNHAEKDLILHLIASHHGWARPCFRPEATRHTGLERNNSILLEIATRYSQLQKRFGSFGLAWLEGLVRGSDWTASDGEKV